MRESLRKNKTGILFMIFSAMMACIGQLFWKLSAEEGIVYLLIGFVFYAVGALSMLIAYRFGSLSVLQPMLSLNYVISLILGVSILGEQITLARVMGVLIIIIGVILIGGGDE